MERGSMVIMSTQSYWYLGEVLGIYSASNRSKICDITRRPPLGRAKPQDEEDRSERHKYRFRYISYLWVTQQAANSIHGEAFAADNRQGGVGRREHPAIPKHLDASLYTTPVCVAFPDTRMIGNFTKTEIRVLPGGPGSPAHLARPWPAKSCMSPMRKCPIRRPRCSSYLAHNSEYKTL